MAKGKNNGGNVRRSNQQRCNKGRDANSKGKGAIVKTRDDGSERPEPSDRRRRRHTGRASALRQALPFESDPSTRQLETQLAKLGLTLKDISPDGNCLFRSLSDQYEGSPAYHAKCRAIACRYQAEHRPDFEPFLLEFEQSGGFDAHLKRMQQTGTFGGHMEIVAFARALDVDVAIHQEGRPVFIVTPDFDEVREAELDDLTTVSWQRLIQRKRTCLHLAYHDWEHYSSIRNINGPKDGPPMIKLRTPPAAGKEWEDPRKLSYKAKTILNRLSPSMPGSQSIREGSPATTDLEDDVSRNCSSKRGGSTNVLVITKETSTTVASNAPVTPTLPLLGVLSARAQSSGEASRLLEYGSCSEAKSSESPSGQDVASSNPSESATKANVLRDQSTLPHRVGVVQTTNASEESDYERAPTEVAAKLLENLSISGANKEGLKRLFPTPTGTSTKLEAEYTGPTADVTYQFNVPEALRKSQKAGVVGSRKAPRAMSKAEKKRQRRFERRSRNPVKLAEDVGEIGLGNNDEQEPGEFPAFIMI